MFLDASDRLMCKTILFLVWMDVTLIRGPCIIDRHGEEDEDVWWHLLGQTGSRSRFSVSSGL